MLKKRLLSLLLSASLLLGLLPVTAAAAPGDPVTFDPLAQGPVQYTVNNVTRRDTLEKAWNAVASSSGGTVTLYDDITASGGSFGTGAGFRGGALVVPRGCQVTLDLRGRKLERNLTSAKTDGGVLIVEGELTMKDSNDTGRGAVMGGNSANGGGGITVASGGILNLQRGNILENASAVKGGGIYNRGTVNMTGGKISKNKGGGVYQGGVFNVSGTVTIAENNDVANTYLPANRTLRVNGLGSSARIGVTAENLPSGGGSVTVAEGSVSGADTAKVVSDNINYVTQLEGSKIVLKEVAPAAAAAPAAMNSITSPSAFDEPGEMGSTGSTAKKQVVVSFFENYNNNKTNGKAVSSIMATVGKAYSAGGFPADPVREGYVFDGWYTSAQDGQGTKVERSTTVTQETDHNLFAHWSPEAAAQDDTPAEEPVQVYVVFDPNGEGEAVTPPDKIVTYGEAYGELPVPVWEGHKFQYWCVSEKGGQVVTENTVVRQNYQHTLYAIWAENEPPVENVSRLISFIDTVTVSGTTEDGQPTTRTEEHIFIDATDENGTMALPEPAACGFSTPNDKEFKGWSIDAVPSDNLDENILEQPGGSHTFDKNTSVYAVWGEKQQTPGITEYKVTYRLDDTSDTDEVVAYKKEGDAFQLIENPFRKVGYTFKGWKHEGASPEKIYQPEPYGESFTMPANDVIFVAVWEVNDSQYTVTFDANYTDAPAATQKLVTPGEPYGSFPSLQREGYRLIGWFTAATDGTQVTETTPVPEASADASGDHTLYAHWVDVCQITYNANGGSGTMTPKTVDKGTSFTLPECTFTPPSDNEEFDGWTLSTTTKEKITAISSVEADTIVYALWKNKEPDPTPTKYTITFNGNGGSGTMDTVEVTPGEEYTLPACGFKAPVATPEKEFAYWASDADGTLEVGAAGGSYAVTGNVTLYAIWKDKQSTVDQVIITFNENYDDKKTTTKTVSAGSKYSDAFPDPEPTRPGYDFLGWYTAETGGTKIIGTETVTANIILYAQWTPKTVTITFNENYEGAPQSQKIVDIGSKYGGAFPDPQPSRADYDFLGWYQKAEGGVEVTDVETVTANSPKTLYALWRGDGQIKLTFDSGDGYGQDYVLIFDENGDMVLPQPGDLGFIPPDGQEFDYWQVVSPEAQAARHTVWASTNLIWAAESSSDVKLHPGDKIPFTNDTVIKAVWRDIVNTVTITYHANNGTEATTTKTVTENAEVELPSCDFTAPTGKTFAGWAIGSAGSGTVIAAGGKHRFSTDTNVYATWTDLAGTFCTVTFDFNYEGAPDDLVVTAEVGKTYQEACPNQVFPAPSREGYTLLGWYMTPSGGTRIMKDTIVTVGTNHTLYALWQATDQSAAPWVLTFNDGKGSTYTLLTDADGYRTLPTPTEIGFNPSDKVFDAWVAETTDGLERLNPGTRYRFGKNTTISALWKTAETTYTITYDANGGTGTMTPGTAEPNTAFTLPECTFTAPGGKVFSGWAVGDKDSTPLKKAGDTYTFTGSTTVYAVWTDPAEAVYTIRFDANGGSGTMKDQETEPGGALRLPACGFDAPSGKGFAYWAIGSTSGERVRANVQHTFTGNTTVYAIWANLSNNSGSSGGSVYHPTWNGGSGGSSSSDKDDDNTSTNVAQVILKASAGTGGSISPSGEVRVERGRDQTFNITAQNGYVISDVLVDGTSVGIVSRYTFDNVQRTHTIQAVFAASPAAAQTQTVQQQVSTPTDYLNCRQDASCPITGYSDIQANAWYHDGVHYCLDEGLMTGTDATHFSPTTPLTRAMLAQIIYNREERPLINGIESTFTDVVKGAWYENAVKYAADTGLVAGYENGAYGPNDPVTREQLVVILWRHAGSPASGVAVPLSDFHETRAYADEAMRWAFGRGIISGKSNGLLDPSGKATRAEVAQMLKSYFDSMI